MPDKNERRAQREYAVASLNTVAHLLEIEPIPVRASAEEVTELFESLSRIQDPILGSADPYGLCNKTYVFAKSKIQDPILGSAGSDCFARQSHSFVYFWTPPRALIIILNKARGASRACLSGPLPELALVL